MKLKINIYNYAPYSNYAGHSLVKEKKFDSMNLQLVHDPSQNRVPHQEFINFLSDQLGARVCMIPKKGRWERRNSKGEWLISNASDFLNRDSILNYWVLDEAAKKQQCGPHLVLPSNQVPTKIDHILLAYSSYPEVEEKFLRLGMDTALRLESHLHCLKIVQPPQVLWSKRQYEIGRGLQCYETITTNDSISQGVIDYAEENQIDLICLLTRPWMDVILDVTSSHSFKVLKASDLPVLLYREDDVKKIHLKIGA